MGRKSKSKFELKGHTLPGINQKSETVNIKDGRSPSSAFQQKSSPNKFIEVAAGLKGVGNFAKKAGGAIGNIFSGGDTPKDKMAAKVDEKLDEKVDEALSEESV